MFKWWKKLKQKWARQVFEWQGLDIGENKK